MDGVKFFLVEHGYIKYTIFLRNSYVILWLEVDEAFRRQGYGSLLLDKFKRWARSQRIHSIYLDSILKQDNDFYKKNGFMRRSPRHKPEEWVWQDSCYAPGKFHATLPPVAPIQLLPSLPDQFTM